MDIDLIPLVEGVEIPRPAPATTRKNIPQGYGVQEQCLPFTAATGLGFLIGSPLSFGLCPESAVPPGAEFFRSPVFRDNSPNAHNDNQWFYVKNDSSCHFSKNAFFRNAQNGPEVVSPGLSFFDREDQQDLLKVHLPYIWRTPQNVDMLFLPGINRAAQGYHVQAGLVETDWYSNPVNLILRIDQSTSFHISRGDPIAQAIFIDRSSRAPTLNVLPQHAKASRMIMKQQEEFYKQLSENKSLYKKLARSRQGFVK